MPAGYIHEQELLLPFQGNESTSLDASYKGAKAAMARAGSQSQRLLALYRERGPLTDHEARKALKLPLATVCARRNALIQRKLVKDHGTKPGPFRTINTTWGIA